MYVLVSHDILKWLSLLSCFLINELNKTLAHIFWHVGNYNLTLIIISSFENDKYISCIPPLFCTIPMTDIKIHHKHGSETFSTQGSIMC